MAEKTLIAWTDHTFNIAWGCTKVSPGCEHCYAETLATRRGFTAWGPKGTRRVLSDNRWKNPAKWNRAAEVAGERRRVFCSSMCDNFEDHPVVASQLDRLWELIRETPWLEWQLLTKRADRIAECLPDDWGPEGYPSTRCGIRSAAYLWFSAETPSHTRRVHVRRGARAGPRLPQAVERLATPAGGAGSNPPAGCPKP